MTIVDIIRSSVRPIVTYLFAGALVYGFLAGMIAPGEFLGIAGLAVGFYFRERDQPSS